MKTIFEMTSTEYANKVIEDVRKSARKDFATIERIARAHGRSVDEKEFALLKRHSRKAQPGIYRAAKRTHREAIKYGVLKGVLYCTCNSC